MINQISKELSKKNIFHKIERNFIKTRRSETKIPKLNKNIVYLLGVIDGDGSLVTSHRKRGGQHYILRIYSGDISHIQYFNSLFEKEFSIKGKISRDKRKNHAYQLIMQNVSIFFYFVILGIEIGKKEIGKLPGILDNNKEYFFEYLAGLVDTDGAIQKNRIHLKQKRLNLLKEIESLSNKYNLNCSIPKINYTNDIPFYYIRFDNKLPLRLKKAFKQTISTKSKPA